MDYFSDSNYKTILLWMLGGATIFSLIANTSGQEPNQTAPHRINFHRFFAGNFRPIYIPQAHTESPIQNVKQKVADISQSSTGQNQLGSSTQEKIDKTSNQQKSDVNIKNTSDVKRTTIGESNVQMPVSSVQQLVSSLQQPDINNRDKTKVQEPVSSVQHTDIDKRRVTRVQRPVSSIQQPDIDKRGVTREQRPVSSVQQPVINNRGVTRVQQSFINKSGVTRVQQPVSNVQQPVINKSGVTIVQQPVSNVPQPVINESGVTRVQRPVSNIQQPDIDKRGVTRVQRPVSSIQQPVINNRGVTRVQQPFINKSGVTRVQQPVSNVQQPVINKSGVTRVQQPVSNVQQPVINKSDVTRVQQPVSNVQQPVINKSDVTRVQQLVSSVQQSVINKSSVTRVKQPVSNVQQPVSRVQHHTINKINVTRVQQPVSNVQQSVSRVKQPVINKNGITRVQQPVSNVQQPVINKSGITRVQQPMPRIQQPVINKSGKTRVKPPVINISGMSNIQRLNKDNQKRSQNNNPIQQIIKPQNTLTISQDQNKNGLPIPNKRSSDGLHKSAVHKRNAETAGKRTGLVRNERSNNRLSQTTDNRLSQTTDNRLSQTKNNKNFKPVNQSEHQNRRKPTVQNRNWRRSNTNWNDPNVKWNGPPTTWNGPNAPWNGPQRSWNEPPNHWNGPFGKNNWGNPNNRNQNWNGPNRNWNGPPNNQNPNNGQNNKWNGPNNNQNQNSGSNRNWNSPNNLQNTNNGPNRNMNDPNNNQNPNSGPNGNWNGPNNNQNPNSGPNRNWNGPNNNQNPNSGPNKNWNGPNNNQNSGPNRNWNGPNNNQNQNSGPSRNWNGPNNNQNQNSGPSRNWNGPNNNQNQNSGPNRNWNGPNNNQNPNNNGNWGNTNTGGPPPYNDPPPPNNGPPPSSLHMGIPLIDPDLPDGLDDRWQRMQAHRAWQEMNQMNGKMGIPVDTHHLSPWGPDPYPQGQQGPYPPPPPGPYPPPPPPPGPYPPGPFLPNKYFGAHTQQKRNFGWPIKNKSRSEIWNQSPTLHTSNKPNTINTQKLTETRNDTEEGKSSQYLTNTTNINVKTTNETLLKPQLAEFQHNSGSSGWQRRVHPTDQTMGLTQDSQGNLHKNLPIPKEQSSRNPYPYNYPNIQRQSQGMYAQLNLRPWAYRPATDKPDHLEDRQNSSIQQPVRNYTENPENEALGSMRNSRMPSLSDTRPNIEIQNQGQENERTRLSQRLHGLARSKNSESLNINKHLIPFDISKPPQKQETIEHGIRSVQIGQSQPNEKDSMTTQKGVWKLANQRLQNILYQRRNMRASAGDVEKETDEEIEGGGPGINARTLQRIISEIHKQGYNKNISIQSIMDGFQESKHKLKLNYRYEAEGSEPLVNEGKNINPELFTALGINNETGLEMSRSTTVTYVPSQNTIRPITSEVIANEGQVIRIQNSSSTQYYPRSGPSFGYSAKYSPQQPSITVPTKTSTDWSVYKFNEKRITSPRIPSNIETSTTWTRHPERNSRRKSYVRVQPLGIIKGFEEKPQNIAATSIPKLSDLVNFHPKYLNDLTENSTSKSTIQVNIETEIKSGNISIQEKEMTYLITPTPEKVSTNISQVGITLPLTGGITQSPTDNTTANATKTEKLQQTPVQIEMTISTSSAFGIIAGSIIGFLVIIGPVICILCRVRKNRRERQRKLSSKQGNKSLDDGGIMEAMILSELGEPATASSTSRYQKSQRHENSENYECDNENSESQTLNSGRNSPTVIVH